MTDTLHDTDFYTWTTCQAAALRDAASRGSNLPIDWEDLTREIEDVGGEIEPHASEERLLGWKLRGITSVEVREDGLYPVRGMLEFRREPD